MEYLDTGRTEAFQAAAAPARLRLVAHLREILSPHAGRVATVIVLILAAALLEGVSFSLLVPLTQVFTAGPSGPSGAGGMFQTAWSWLAGYPSETRLAILGVTLVALFALKNGLQYLREILSTDLWLSIGTETRTRVLAGMLRRPYRYFLDRKQGSLVQHLYHEPHHVAFIIQMGIEQSANILAVAVLVGLLVLVSWQVTLLVFAFGVAYGLGIWRLSRLAHAGGEERQVVEAEAMALLTEAVGGIRQVKVFSAERRIQDVYAGWVRRYQELNVRHWLATLLPQHVTELFWVGVLGLLLCLPAAGLITDLHTLLPVMAVFSAVAFRIGPYASRISQGWLSLKFFLPALNVVGHLLDETETGDGREGGQAFHRLERAIQFEQVGFSYGGDSPALSALSVRFARGETTAIIGPSGAGKSTLVDLLVRLYDPTGGRILVDDMDLRGYDRASWLAAIGFVSQDTFIFHGTIRDNIAFSKPGATPESVQAAARLANAHEFIERAPQGYDTVVGDRGLKLSGGERQRIAIARALLREPQILIFDEATSALDNQSEAMIQETITRIAHDRTVILIAHRLSTVVRADKIVVLDRGRAVEEGTHETLLKEGGVYANLYGTKPA